uniref:Uncharacterized protein n=1 Tax=Timema shepardi TaxID=629360 RepID=A0A7R9B4U9_TIMSH|nr:unnamed protein product [Timema shepardi]
MHPYIKASPQKEQKVDESITSGLSKESKLTIQDNRSHNEVSERQQGTSIEPAPYQQEIISHVPLRFQRASASKVPVLNQHRTSSKLSATYHYASSERAPARLQQIYQSLRPGKESFQVESVKRIQNASEAIDYLHSLEDISSVAQAYNTTLVPTANTLHGAFTRVPIAIGVCLEYSHT